MPDQTEELKLVVTLVDNASGPLAALQEHVKEGLGGSEMKNAVERHKKDTEELTKIAKRMTGEYGDLFESILKFRGGLVGTIGVLGAVGGAMGLAINEMNKFGQELRNINQTARAMGEVGADLKDMQEQMADVGVSAETTAEGVRKLGAAQADLQRQGSELAEQLRKAAGWDPERQRNMEAFIDAFKRAKTPAEEFNLAMKAYNNAIREAQESGDPRQIRERTDAINKAFSALVDPKMVAARKGMPLTVMTPEERAAQQERLDAGERFSNTMSKIHGQVSTIVELLKAPWFDKLNEGAQALVEKLEKMIELTKEAQKPIEKLEPEEGPKSHPYDPRYWGLWGGISRWGEEREKAGPPPVPHTWGDLPFWGGTTRNEPEPEHRQAEPEHRQAGGPVHSGRAYLVGERGPELMVPGSSGTAIPHEMLQNASLSLEQKKNLEENTEATKALTKSVEELIDLLRPTTATGKVGSGGGRGGIQTAAYTTGDGDGMGPYGPGNAATRGNVPRSYDGPRPAQTTPPEKTPPETPAPMIGPHAVGPDSPIKGFRPHHKAAVQAGLIGAHAFGPDSAVKGFRPSHRVGAGPPDDSAPRDAGAIDPALA